jgi:hypothetical protein
MTTTTINGHKVQIFETQNGTELYISNPEGDCIYAHKIGIGDPMERARAIIPAEVVERDYPFPESVLVELEQAEFGADYVPDTYSIIKLAA